MGRAALKNAMHENLKKLQIGDFVEFVDLPAREDGGQQSAASDKAYWAVCQAFSNRMHRIRPEIEKANRGTFLPTYARLWIKEGRPWSKERQLMPGYLFFLTEPDKWGDVRNTDGVYAVLTTARGVASKVNDDEMRRLVLNDAMGVHNDIQATVSDSSKKRYSRRRPRPRRGKRIAMRAAA